MTVKCGNHRDMTQPVYHQSIADVRACYAEAGTPEHWAGGFARQDASEQAARDSRNAQRRQAGVMDRLKRAHGNNPRMQSAAAEVDPKFRPATPKQVSFLRALLASKDIPADQAAYFDSVSGQLGDDGLWGNGGDGDSGAAYEIPATLGIREASIAIDKLVKLPAKPKQTSAVQPASATASLATEDGIYRNPATGEVFKGQFNRAQGDGRHLYFKQLVLTWFDAASGDTRSYEIPLDGSAPIGSLSWEYAGSAAKAGVKASWKVTREEAEKFGRLYGVCIRCHRDLTKEESIDRAMGPVCAGKMGW